MIKHQEFHQSISRIPPAKLIKYPIIKQSGFANLIFGKFLRKYGVSQVMSYHRTRLKAPKATFPYMPRKLPDNAHLYDFHFHSYYSDGRGTFRDLLMEISRKKHLNGLTITDHPYHLGKSFNDRIPSERVIAHSYRFQKRVDDLKKSGKLPENFISFPGSCEFFTKLHENTDSEIELIVLGVPKDFVKKNGGIKRLTNYCHAVELIEKVHDENGLVILPHPFFFTRAHELLRFKLSRNSRPDAVEGLNYTTGFIYDKAYYGFLEKLPFFEETKSIVTNFGYFNWMATIVSQKNNYGKHFNYPLAREIGTVGSSDAHFHTMIGAAATMIREPIYSIEDLRRVFAKRETLPIYNPLWSRATRRIEVFKEIWDAYGHLIIEGLEKESFFRWIVAKTFVNLLMLKWK